MAAVWNRAGHYILLCGVYLSFFFFCYLFSAVGDWMSTILLHMVWPYCKFRMQVWNLLHAAHRKYGTQKWCKKSPSAHHRTMLSGCIFATKACVDNRKKLIKQQYVLYMAPQYGELRSTNGWDRFGSLGHPSKFQRVSHLAYVIAAMSLTGPNQTLHNISPSTGLVHYIYIFGGSCPLTDFCQVQNSLYVQVLCSRILAALLHNTSAAGISQTLRHGTRNGITELSQRAPPIFDRAAITLGIGPRSSFVIFSSNDKLCMYVTCLPCPLQ